MPEERQRFEHTDARGDTLVIAEVEDARGPCVVFDGGELHTPAAVRAFARDLVRGGDWLAEHLGELTTVERGDQVLCRFVFPGHVVPRREMAQAVLERALGTGDPTQCLEKHVAGGSPSVSLDELLAWLRADTRPFAAMWAQRIETEFPAARRGA